MDKSLKISIIIILICLIILSSIIFGRSTIFTKIKDFVSVNVPSWKNDKIDTSNFVDFQFASDSFDEASLKSAITSGNYQDRSYYEIFNFIYFLFHVKDSSLINKCIDNKETGECTFYNAVLSDNENVCNELPTVRKVESPGKYGSTYNNIYYRLGCILNTRMYKRYSDEVNKDLVCQHFSEQYIRDECLNYTCNSYFWGNNKPEMCK